MKKFEQLFSTHAVMRRIMILCLIAILGYIDFATGYEYSFSVFYLIPVSLAAWYDNIKVTVITIILSALTWLSADYVSGHHYSFAVIPFWNALVRLGFFSVVAILLVKVRTNLAEMTMMAMKDTLTSLNNSRAFNLQYQLLRKLSNRKKMQFAVGIVDLDGFKAVNDTMGHSKGDEVLVEFAHVLQDATRTSDVVARMGGDEFAVILMGTDASGAQEYDQRLRGLFDSSGLKRDYGVDFSMGISIFNDLPDDPDEATHQADLLMYKSKELGKSQTTICVI